MKFEAINQVQESTSIKVSDGPGAEVHIEPLNPEESNSHWAVSLCIDFTPFHPAERMLRVYMTAGEANDVGMALLKAVNKGYKVIQ